MAEIISLADRRKPSPAYSAAMRAVAEFTRSDFQADREQAAKEARMLVERRLYGSPHRLARFWVSYRFAQSIGDTHEVRRSRRDVLTEIERIRLTRKLVGPKAKFQPGERVLTTMGLGVVERSSWHAPARGEAHFRYWVRLLDGGHIDAAEGNLKVAT
jgi:hypothetical protein